MSVERRELIGATARTRELFSYDFATEETRIIEIEDCGPLVEAARILADQPPGKDFRHAAYIPQYVFNRAFREGWLHDKAAWKRWANDPENAAFRTWKGRL